MIIVSPLDISKLKTKDIITLECEYCHQQYKRTKHEVQHYIQKNQGKYCSKFCQCAARHTGKILSCKNCGKDIYVANKKTLTLNHFCSKSCSAIHNNKLFPKKKTNRVCIICGKQVKSYRHNKCEEHWKQYKENKWKNKTIGEYRNKISVKGKHPSWIHAAIRNFARSWLKHLTVIPCARCGYDKHVELAHIKDIIDFSDDALLSEVNAESNVIQLCPNCHWEFDNDIWKIEEVRS